LLRREAGVVDEANRNLTYGNLTLINAQKIYNITRAFALEPARENLIMLKKGEIVGEWRDSTYGLGGGRIPFDVNTALAPAALRSLGALARTEGVFPSGTFNASELAANAQVWEDETLRFFEVSIEASEAESRLEDFVDSQDYYSGPTNADTLPSDGNVTSYALALDGYDNLTTVPVLHSDTSFRLFFVNATNQTQLTQFMNSTASELTRPFPAGLSTGVGMVVANPALSGSDVLIANFTNSAYHGTVVWSWTLAMMAEGLNRQLARCEGSDEPDWCGDDGVYDNVVNAYNMLWDGIEANEAQLQSEVWSWTYSNSTGNSTDSGGDVPSGYTVTPLGALPPPPGVSSGTESNVRQLWSLTFLAVKRNEAYSS
jgi:hypothetical protein